MRVGASRIVRVGPGDEVVVQARLPADQQLGRLYVFAKSRKDPKFSPYVITRSIMRDNEPELQTPISMRLVTARPERNVSFTSDIDGYVRVMQEVDTIKDPVVKVKLKRRVNPHLPLKYRVLRHIGGMMTWMM